jgi:TorA-specific chaperone
MTQNNSDIKQAIQIMCRLFWGPDLESCHQMIEGDFFQPFETLFAKPDQKSSTALDSIKSIINKFDTDQSIFDQLDECYVRLFVNSKEGITAPLYQSCYEYENAPMMGESAIKMMDLFKSKGLSMENRLHEPPDHIAVELEYLFFLLQENGVDQNEINAFAGQTMLPWIQAFNQRLESVRDDCRFYYLTSKLLIQVLKILYSKL